MYAANKALTDIVKIYNDELEDCTKLNIMYYAAAITIAGEEKKRRKDELGAKNDVKKENILNKITKANQSIKNIRAKVGKLTDYVKGPTT